MAQEQKKLLDNEHGKRVRGMFADIAARYDLLNHLLSGNTDKRWRRILVEELKGAVPTEGARLLDVACGTGDLCLALTSAIDERVVGLDFCRTMLEIAKRKTASRGSDVLFIEGDALALPFADESFDAVSIAFGLRNLSSLDGGLRELKRVLKPGGRAFILEFSSPVIPGFRTLFNLYFSRVLPRIGGLLSGSRSAYEYLPVSVSRFPNQQRLADSMRSIGFQNVGYRNLTGGVAALHLGTR